MFGVGSYFAENASKADRYTWSATGRQQRTQERCIIVARVCLGSTHITPIGMPAATMPPNRLDGSGSPLDSVTAEKRNRATGFGGAVDLREYVVYDKGQALPEYKIWYKHEQRCECAQCKD